MNLTNIYDEPNHVSILYTSLHSAAEKKNAERVQQLILNKQNVNVQDVTGYTPLHTAVIQENNEEVIQVLLAAGANMYQPDMYGQTPLKIAGFCAGNYAVLKNGEKLLQIKILSFLRLFS